MNLLRIDRYGINLDHLTEFWFTPAKNECPAKLRVAFGADNQTTFDGDDAIQVMAAIDPYCDKHGEDISRYLTKDPPAKDGAA